DLPEPESPVNTTRLSRGRSRSTFLRLCSRAPRIEMNLPGAGRFCLGMGYSIRRGGGRGRALNLCSRDAKTSNVGVVCERQSYVAVARQCREHNANIGALPLVGASR